MRDITLLELRGAYVGARYGANLDWPRPLHGPSYVGAKWGHGAPPAKKKKKKLTGGLVPPPPQSRDLIEESHSTLSE